MTLPSGETRTTFRPIAPKPGSCPRRIICPVFVTQDSVVERPLYSHLIDSLSSVASSTLLQSRSVSGSWAQNPANLLNLAPATTRAASSSIKVDSPANSSVSRHLKRTMAMSPKASNYSTISPRRNAAYSDSAVIVNFSAYEKLVSPSSLEIGSQRTSYAEVVVPDKKLHVPSKSYLRLFDLVPKGRTGDTYAGMTSAEAIAVTRKDASPAGQRTAHSFQSPTSHDFTDGVQRNEFTLRPSARLLTRLGQRLIRHQYGRFEKRHHPPPLPATVETESEAAETTAYEVLPGNSVPSSSRKPGDEREDRPDPLIGQIVWRRKQLSGRWASTKDLCEERRCPFVPTSALGMHRHLELGHNLLFSLRRLSRSHRPLVRQVTANEPTPTGADQSTDESLVNGVSRPPQRQQLRYLKREEQEDGEKEKDGGGAATNLFVVALLPESVGDTQQLRFQCPVCARRKLSYKGYMDHCVREHPFLTIQPAGKTPTNLCTVCGFVSGRMRQLRPNLQAHYRCQPNVASHRSLPWSNQDVPALACFVLFPNQLSRFYLPQQTAYRLIKTLDQVLSVHVGRLNLWTLQSMALRSILAVSSLYGELIDSTSVIMLNDAVVVSARKAAGAAAVTPSTSDKTVNSKVQKVTIICCPPVMATISMTAATTADAAVASLVTASTSSFTTAGSSSSPSNATATATTNTTLISTTTITAAATHASSSSSNVNYRKRSQPASDNNSCPADDYGISSAAKRLATANPLVSGQPTVASPIFINDDVEQQNSDQQCQPNRTVVNLDDVDYGSDEDEEEADAMGRRTNANAHGELDCVQAYLGRQLRDLVALPQGSSVPRQVTLSGTQCEICNTEVLASNFHLRLHMVSMHRVKCSSFPEKHCYFCGKLFWTAHARAAHSNITCLVCSSDSVCQSTLYTHMILKHRAELLTSMQDLPAVCLLCEMLFTTTARLVWHLYTVHLFRSPRENCNNRDHHSSFPSTRLRDFGKFKGIISQQYDYQRRKSIKSRLHLPANILSHPVAGRKLDRLACFRCSTCSSMFISIPHLDLHMLQTGHQYACPDCDFFCDHGVILSVHYEYEHRQVSVRDGTASSGVSSTVANTMFLRAPAKTSGLGVGPPPTGCTPTASSLRLVRVLNGTPAVIQSVTSNTTASNVGGGSQLPVSLASAVSQAAVGGAAVVGCLQLNQQPTATHNPVGVGGPSARSGMLPGSSVNAISQILHRCTKCPVFCLNLEDLKVHLQSAHSQQVAMSVTSGGGPRLAQQQPTVMLLPDVSTGLSGVPREPTTPLVVQHHRAHIGGAVGGAGPGLQPTVRPSASGLLASLFRGNRPPVPTVATAGVPMTATGLPGSLVSNVGGVPLDRDPAVAPQPGLRLAPLAAPSKSVPAQAPAGLATHLDMIMCPLCEFQATERSLILSHVARVHGR